MKESMKLIEVTTPAHQRQFLECPVSLYAGDSNWVRPRDVDIERVFDPKQNKFWRHGRAIRWILLDDKGKCIGRVAAFVNDRTAKTFDQPTGGMGFFECINDFSAAKTLFDACKTWLQQQGMEAMDGPINFGDRDAWWGVLAKGFLPPTYQMNYNPPYYVDLFRQYGFEVYYEQFVLYRALQDPIPARFEEKYELVMKEPGFTFEHIRKNNLDKYARDFQIVYNKAWGRHDGFREMNEQQVKMLMKNMKPIIAEELIWFGYHNGEPVCFFFMIPDMNQVFKRFNGKFGLWQKLRTWLILRSGSINRCYGVLFGVVPAYQGKGLDGAIVKAAGLVIHPQKKWNHMEMNWIGDFNPKMLNVAKGVGGEVIKTYYTMRKLFDESKPFKRSPILH